MSKQRDIEGGAHVLAHGGSVRSGTENFQGCRPTSSPTKCGRQGSGGMSVSLNKPSASGVTSIRYCVVSPGRPRLRLRRTNTTGRSRFRNGFRRRRANVIAATARGRSSDDIGKASSHGRVRPTPGKGGPPVAVLWSAGDRQSAQPAKTAGLLGRPREQGCSSHAAGCAATHSSSRKPRSRRLAGICSGRESGSRL